jgi:large conductance mechanosensitive channel
MKGFRKFILRGNLVDLAVAVVIGTQFSGLVHSFVSSFVDPLLALIGGKPNLNRFTFNVGKSTFTYGTFLTDALSFLISAAVVYFVIVLPVKKLQERRKRGQEPGPSEPTDVELLIEIRDLLRAQYQRDTDRD